MHKNLKSVLSKLCALENNSNLSFYTESHRKRNPKWKYPNIRLKKINEININFWCPPSINKNTFFSCQRVTYYSIYYLRKITWTNIVFETLETMQKSLLTSVIYLKKIHKCLFFTYIYVLLVTRWNCMRND